MEEARKLMDSLMGGNRDSSLEEAKKSKGKNFQKDDVCKYALLGFCPYAELSESKMCVKRNIGKCTNKHSDYLRHEFEAHPDRAKFQAEYEKLLLVSLERQVREADAWHMRETANMMNEQGPPREVEKSTMPPAEKEKYDALKEDLNKMMAAAEEDAEKGNLDASKFKVMLAEDVKSKVKDLEDQYPNKTFTVTSRAEEVCKVCGVRFEALNPNNQQRYDAHFTGAVHRTYAKIRDWIAKLSEKNSGVERNADKADNKRGGDGDRKERDGDRDRERDRDRKPERDRERERERRRSRSRRSRSRRDNRGDRGSDRDRDRGRR